MKLPVILHDGRIEMSDFHKGKLRQAIRDNGGPIRAEIQTLMPESRKQRAYLHGALIPLWVKLDGNEYRESSLCDFYFELFKREKFPEAVKVNGKIEIMAKSSKGSNNLNKIVEMMIDFLVEDYGLYHHSDVLNPENYKRWRDELFSFGKWDHYLEYAEEMGWLKFNRIK